jgi:tetrapyrrole methylase family protein / MazG family protein
VKPRVRIVGLGPGDPAHVTLQTVQLLESSTVARLRTRIHPSAGRFENIASYDQWYEEADSFEALYQRIVDDLVGLATSSPTSEVVYAVPGSPVVAEHTVELLLARDDVDVVLEPAVSVIDVACAALRVDPMTVGVRVLDALGSTEMFRGPGPLLILQAYSPEVLATVADRLPRDTSVTILHHLGMSDVKLVTLDSQDLPSFSEADHLTSLWVDGLRTAGEAMDDLVSFMRRLRSECPWDQEQTHASLTRHLLEESYEAMDALEALVREEANGSVSAEAAANVEEELGDLLFQVVFHAELGDEEELFSFATIADAVRDKLTGRHPHVFGDVVVKNSDEVAANWEDIKKVEKGRTSVTDGIAWQLPSPTLYAKLLRKATALSLPTPTANEALELAHRSLDALVLNGKPVSDATSTSEAPNAWGDLFSALVVLAQWSGVDVEGVLRERALQLRDEILSHENSQSK